MAVTSEQNHWNKWNIGEVNRGLAPDRVALRDTVVGALLDLKLPKNSPLVEIACGVGWVGEQLYRDFDYIGLDLAPSAIEAARARVPEARFEAADFLEWPAPTGKHSAVLCVDAVAYFRDQDVAMKKIHDTLQSRGWLVISTLNPFIYSRMKWVGPPGEGQVRKWLTKSQFHDLLTRNGFEILSSKTIEPGGDTGFLRVLNARKVKALMSIFLGKTGYRRILESIGLGQYRVVVARRTS